MYKIINGNLQAGASGSGSAREVFRFEVAPTLSTSIYAVNDVFFESIKITDEDGEDAAGWDGGGIEIQSISVFDKEQINADFNLLFMRSNVAVGTINISDALDGTNFDELCFSVPVHASDYENYNIISEARLDTPDVQKIAWAVAGSKEIYVAALCKGTPNFSTTNAMELNITFKRV